MYTLRGDCIGICEYQHDVINFKKSIWERVETLKFLLVFYAMKWIYFCVLSGGFGGDSGIRNGSLLPIMSLLHTSFVFPIAFSKFFLYSVINTLLI